MATLLKRGLTADASLAVLSSAGPGSYSTGGFDPGFPAGTILAAFGISSAGHVCVLDQPNKKMKVFWSGTASAVLNEVTATTNLSTTTFYVLCYTTP